MRYTWPARPHIFTKPARPHLSIPVHKGRVKPVCVRLVEKAIREDEGHGG